MDQVGTWIGIGIAVVGLVVAIITYVRRLPRTRLEYLVAANSSLLPQDLPESFYLAHRDWKVPKPAIAIVRLVNTGDRAVPASSFETDLHIRLVGASEVVSANCIRHRPSDLAPTLAIDGSDTAHLKALLLNPGDMLEIQLLSAGKASAIEITGRVSDLSIVRRTSPPYPPGSGVSGEFEGPVDYFMWFLAIPAFILGVGALIATNGDYSNVGRLAAAGVTLVIAFLIYPLQLRYLMRRRLLWAR